MRARAEAFGAHFLRFGLWLTAVFMRAGARRVRQLNGNDAWFLQNSKVITYTVLVLVWGFPGM